MPRAQSIQLTGVFIVVAAGLLISVTRYQADASRAINPLPDYGLLPDFSLTDHQGHPFRRTETAGSVWIADFIFTRCAGQCPLMSTQMAALTTLFRDGEPVQFVSLTVDPDYDTPTILAAYAHHYRTTSTRWRFVTGDRDAVVALAQQGFHLAVGEAEGTPAEPITHSVRFVLIDQRGHIRGYYDATDPEAVRRLTRDAKRLLERRRG